MRLRFRATGMLRRQACVAAGFRGDGDMLGERVLCLAGGRACLTTKRWIEAGDKTHHVVMPPRFSPVSCLPQYWVASVISIASIISVGILKCLVFGWHIG